ncbi:MAG: hypothetical protein LPD71_11470, partial [Shewanella sp.]|nr:hypothetical protein [Shewanella sp.]
IELFFVICKKFSCKIKDQHYTCAPSYGKRQIDSRLPHMNETETDYVFIGLTQHPHTGIPGNRFCLRGCVCRKTTKRQPA